MTIEEVATRFVTMVSALPKTGELKPEHFSVEDQTFLFEIVTIVGFDPHGLVAKKIRGHYRDQDGSSTGQTFPINGICPFTVQYRSESFGIREESRINDHQRATGWLNTLVGRVRENREELTNEERATLVAEEIKNSIPLNPILLDETGNRLKEYPADDGVNHTRDTDPIKSSIGVHERCNGFMDAVTGPEKFNVIICRKCFLRVYMPVEIKTYYDLRRWVENSH